MEIIKKNYKQFVNRKTIEEFIRYLVSGSIMYFFELSVLIFLTDVVGIWYFFSHIVASILTFIFSFVIYSYWTFRVKENKKEQLIKSIILYLVNIILVSALYYILTDIVGINYIVSKFILGCIVVSYKFILYKIIIFTK